MSATRPAVFLERRSYRRRRLADAARMLPFFGALLFAVPLLWPHPDPTATSTGEAATQAVPMSAAMLYVFAAWAGLVVMGAVLGILTRELGTGTDSGQDGPG